ncbi:hypothetical protein F2Q68_00044994 [Brassica cretica]|uniref:Ubiquitin-like protease family profile domain-containing protein n=1 Tax=Brassica cretica TaxID=69181 RepID=A0A8S9LNE6_BRACR|nr:hypothetical protein F2Q68_00044994 [Brassica cretica]
MGEDGPRPWARTARAEVTSPMAEDGPRRGHLAHGRGPTSCPETVHPCLSSHNTILGPLDAIPMSRLVQDYQRKTSGKVIKTWSPKWIPACRIKRLCKWGAEIDTLYAPMIREGMYWVGLRISLSQWNILVLDPNPQLKTMEKVEELVEPVASILSYIAKKMYIKTQNNTRPVYIVRVQERTQTGVIAWCTCLHYV